jgi:hypothetical protein
LLDPEIKLQKLACCEKHIRYQIHENKEQEETEREALQKKMALGTGDCFAMGFHIGRSRKSEFRDDDLDVLGGGHDRKVDKTRVTASCEI